MRIVASRPDPALLGLPWDVPLEDWTEHVVPVPRGLSRHVVRVIQVGGTFYAVKETVHELAEREYRLLRRLNRTGLPSVRPQAVVSDRPHDLPAALVTRHLAFALPYRALFLNGLPPSRLPVVVDALVVLLVRLHLAGFYWGDVSLSNVLFRRSAGEFAAYLVDAETGEFHDALSPRMRENDVVVGCENVFAELLDVAAAELVEEVDPHAVVEQITTRYTTLWDELTGSEEFAADDVWRIEQRIDRLNELGFDVEELDMSTGADTIRIQPRVVEAGHHSRELEDLTGLEVEDNQARRLLTDLASFSAHYGLTDRRAAADRWRAEVYDRIAAMIPAGLRGRLEPAEVFHEILEHRWLLSERAGHEVNIFDTAEDYIATQLGHRPETRLSPEL
jgi:hypothetical protein